MYYLFINCKLSFIIYQDPKFSFVVNYIALIHTYSYIIMPFECPWEGKFMNYEIKETKI